MQPFQESAPHRLIVREMTARHMTYDALEAATGLPKLALALVIAGEAPITAEVAAGLERAFGSDAGIWLRLQEQRDKWRDMRHG